MDSIIFPFYLQSLVLSVGRAAEFKMDDSNTLIFEDSNVISRHLLRTHTLKKTLKISPGYRQSDL